MIKAKPPPTDAQTTTSCEVAQGQEPGPSRLLEQPINSDWRETPKPQLEQLKREGIHLRQRTPGRLMLRLRVPGGRLTSTQARAIGAMANAFSAGRVDITARAQVQLHNIAVERVGSVVGQLRDAGLTSRLTLADSVRSIRTCPLAGLVDHEAVDALTVVDRIDRCVMDDPLLADLPRKVNIAVTGCTHQCCDTPAQDIALIPALQPTGSGMREEIANGRVGFNVLVGGKISAGACHVARPLDVWVSAEQAHEMVVALLHVFAANGPRKRRTESRLVYLVEQWGIPRLRQAIEAELDYPLLPAGQDLRDHTDCNSLGFTRQRKAHRWAVGLHVPVGVIRGDDLYDLATLVEVHGNGTLRLTAAQNLVLPDIREASLPALRQSPLFKRLTPTPLPILSQVKSCVGAAYCSLAIIETKDYALEVAEALAQRMPDLPDLRIHWSGCRAGCGQHAIADIGLVGRKSERNGQKVDAVDIYLGGSAGANPRVARRVMEAVPCSDLVDTLEAMIRNGQAPTANRGA